MWQLMGRSQRWRETTEWQEPGAFAFGGEDVQAELLRADGVEVINGRVDLGKYGICVCGNLGKNSGRY